jgi:hypothetical protein
MMLSWPFKDGRARDTEARAIDGDAKGQPLPVRPVVASEYEASLMTKAAARAVESDAPRSNAAEAMRHHARCQAGPWRQTCGSSRHLASDGMVVNWRCPHTHTIGLLAIAGHTSFP